MVNKMSDGVMANADPLVAGLSQSAHLSEVAVVGGLIRMPECYDVATRYFGVDDLAVFHHRAVFKLIGQVVADGGYQMGKPLDLVTLAQRLAVEHPGEAFYDTLVNLWTLGLPTAATFEYHAKLIRDRTIFRELGVAGRKIAQLGESPHGSAAEMVQEASKALEAVSSRSVRREPVPLAQVMDRLMDEIDRRSVEEARRGWRTGIDALDGLLGAFRPGELTALAGRPAVGKTSVAIAFAHAAAKQGCRVLFVSCEMRDVELAERMLSSVSLVPLRKIREAKLDVEAVQLLVGSRNELDPLPLYIDDEPRQSVGHIASQARQMRRRFGLGMVVIDYLGLLKMPASGGITRQQAVGQATRELKILAREMDVPVILLCQLNRQVEGRGGRPRMSDLRESGDIEQDCDNVLLLHLPEEQPLQQSAGAALEVIVDKQRHGPTGTITTRFLRHEMRFEPMAGVSTGSSAQEDYTPFAHN